jgi:hypothetical protein
MTEKDGLDRREFLRRAAITGAVVWAAPVVQTVAATPAYAQERGTPVEEDCFHSVGGQDGEGCMGACTSVCDRPGGPGGGGNACDGTDPDQCNPLGQGPCQTFCPSGQGGDNPCCNPGLCDPANFTCVRVANCTIAAYTGSLVGCLP